MECLRNKFTDGVLLDGGRYRTLSPLNHGSFGMVFKAQDVRSGQIVAIKCLTKKASSNDACLDLAVDERSEEYALHSSLGLHLNIVNLLDKFETDAHLYLVMEYCSQGDLYEAIRNSQGPLQTEHVRQFMLQLVDAVDYIHSKGVFHRDIKPENIFLAQDGTMKLGDFGLATTDKWSYETTVGSDRYMAPEQFDSAGDGYSPAAADIWAIGICLLNTLFSRNPFATPTEADKIFLDFSRDKQSLFDVFPTMSQDTYEVIVHCMNLDPRRRSIGGARDALHRVVSFTTEDESLDDFCVTEKATIASAHREPLRTPSIQSPHFEGGAFPWAKVLHETPACRQLSAIPDDETYEEDLFSKSGETNDWCSASIQTPSSSLLESHLGFSVSSNKPGRYPPTKVSPMAGSLPILMGRPSASILATAFQPLGKAHVSKSWSDMWEEDEEEELEQQRLSSLDENNARSFSRSGSKDRDQSKGSDKTETVVLAHTIKGNVDDDLVADGFFFHEPTAAQPADTTVTSRYTAPKPTNMDKWAALGERRRALKPLAQPKPPASKQTNVGFGYKQHESSAWAKDRAKIGHCMKATECNWRQRPGLAGIEWVGGW